MAKTFKAGVPYEEALYQDLQNDEFTAEYLSAALDDGDLQVFLLAMRDVVKARGGFAALAKKTGLAREQLYRTLSERGNPRLHNLEKILEAVGLHISFRAIALKSPSKRRGPVSNGTGHGLGSQAS